MQNNPSPLADPRQTGGETLPATNQKLKGWLREPLIHFLALGAMLFGIFGWLGQTVSLTPPPKIVVPPERIEQLINFFNIDYKRPPTTQEVDRIIEDYIREEVLCRQAWAQGLDREDTVIRARLRKNMESLNADVGNIPPASDEELGVFLKGHPEIFRRAGQVPELNEARSAVESAWLAAKRKEASDTAYERLRQQYVIEIQRPKPSTQPSTTHP